MQRIETANQQALDIMLKADPVLIDVIPAVQAIPALGEGKKILHAGPPIEWHRMCGPMQGAVAGIAVFEGWADDLDDAMQRAANGDYEFHPNHHFDAVGPMTGMTTRSQPLMVVENRTHGNRAYCAINEGLGKVMRFGGNDESVLAKLAWLRDVLGPLMGKALRSGDGVALKNLVARGLTMGDEMHQRNVACSGLLLRALSPSLARANDDTAVLAEALAFMGGNDQFFLNVAMACGKSMMDPVRNIDHCCVVTAMSRNGTDFGIRVSGTGDQWLPRRWKCPKGCISRGLRKPTPIPTWVTPPSWKLSGWAALPWARHLQWPGLWEPALHQMRRCSPAACARLPVVKIRNGPYRRWIMWASPRALIFGVWLRRALCPRSIRA